MKIHLRNIGKVKTADVEINGITVIAGENDTGKSTVGKALYCIFNGMHDPESMIRSEREKSIQDVFRKSLLLKDDLFRPVSYFRAGMFDAVLEILSKKDVYLADRELLRKRLREITEEWGDVPEDVTTEQADRIYELLKVDDLEVLKAYLDSQFNKMFYGEIQNIFSENMSGCVELDIRNEKTGLSFENNSVRTISGLQRLLAETIYIDDPFVLDDLMVRGRKAYLSDYKSALIEKLVTNEMMNPVESVVIREKTEPIINMINTACSGTLEIRTMRAYYSFGKDGKRLPVQDISMGLKSFVILKTLLLNGAIEEKGSVVLDEPEIHLHPSWQLLFAEALVMMQKAFNLHILINTHSPYFMRAIEVYSAKHGIHEKCRYYLAENVDEHSAEIRDVTNDREQIYKKLAKPFQVLEDESAGLDGF